MTFHSWRQQQKVNNFRQRYKSQARATNSFIGKSMFWNGANNKRNDLIFISFIWSIWTFLLGRNVSISFWKYLHKTATLLENWLKQIFTSNHIFNVHKHASFFANENSYRIQSYEINFVLKMTKLVPNYKLELYFKQ